MSDPKFHRTVSLGAPFEDHSITVDTEPPMRIWIAARKALLELPTQPGDSLEDAINPVLDTFAPMIVSHDLVAVDTGEPLKLRFESMSPGQLREVLRAMQGILAPETVAPAPGEPADPLPLNRRARRAASARTRTSSPRR